MCQNFATVNSTLINLAQYGQNVAYDLLFFYSTFLSPLTSLIDFFSLLTIFLSLPTSVLSQPVFFPQIKPKNLLSSLFASQNKLQFLVQNKTQKWNHHKSRKNKGIGDGGEVELGARGGEAMKISVWAVSEVHEGEVCRLSVHHDHGIRIDVGIDVEVRSESMLRWDRSVRHDRGHRR